MRWPVTGACVLAGVLVGCSSEPAMVVQLRKLRMIDTLQRKLLESVEAEKSAVLASTDEASRSAAQEASDLHAQVNVVYEDLRALILADRSPEEIAKLEVFGETWTELQGMDQRLLPLAVANTNIKAFHMVSHEGSAALARLVDVLLQMQRLRADAEEIRVLSRVAIAAQRMQMLLFVHIPSASDAEMTQMEQQIRSLQEEVEGSFETLRHSEPPPWTAAAVEAWNEYRDLTPAVLHLSRQNSNVLSNDISVHEKRRATKRCLEALAALSGAVDRGPHATR